MILGLSGISWLVCYLLFIAQKNNIGDKPNYFLGYRSTNSMKSTEIWRYAQTQFKVIFIKGQLILLLMGSIWSIYDFVNFGNGKSYVFQTVLYFISIIIIILLTELRVKKYVVKSNDK